MHTISSYHGNRPTHPQTDKDRLQYTVPQLARSVNISSSLSVSKSIPVIIWNCAMDSFDWLSGVEGTLIVDVIRSLCLFCTFIYNLFCIKNAAKKDRGNMSDTHAHTHTLSLSHRLHYNTVSTSDGVKDMTHKAKAKDLTCHAALKPHKHFTLFNVNTSKTRKQYLKLSMVASLVYYSDVLVTLKHHDSRDQTTFWQPYPLGQGQGHNPRGQGQGL